MAIAVAVAGCSAGTEPDVKPTRADIEVSGTSTVPLQLVVSTDFVEFIDPVEGTRRQSFNSADTLVLTSLPYTTTIQLTELASIVVEVSNPAVTPATVRLRVEVDSGQQPYDREAIMSEGGALRYVFSYFSPQL
jgi:hypothetical protein